MPLGEDPAADDLLAIARDVLLKELLPALPPDKAHAARMVANAMAIAARAAAQDGTWEAAALARMPGDPRGFAAAIRDGRFDPGTAQHADSRRVRPSVEARRQARIPPVPAAHVGSARTRPRAPGARAGEKMVRRQCARRQARGGVERVTA